MSFFLKFLKLPKKLKVKLLSEKKRKTRPIKSLHALERQIFLYELSEKKHEKEFYETARELEAKRRAGDYIK